jgi:hypothetical protein
VPDPAWRLSALRENTMQDGNIRILGGSQDAAFLMKTTFTTIAWTTKERMTVGGPSFTTGSNRLSNRLIPSGTISKAPALMLLRSVSGIFTAEEGDGTTHSP